jgi:dTDP-4-amino-4,6-dideoxygalactose transaminase
MTALRQVEERARVPFARAELSAEAKEGLRRVADSGWLTTGPEVAEFEREFASFVGATHAIGVASCTAAIELALRAMRLPQGAKVLSSTNTFCGAVSAIVHAGLRPVLADIDARTLMPNEETVRRAVARAGGADAMVIVHFAGYPAPVEGLARAAGLGLDRVVEDAAHAVGAAVANRPVGSISRATCFSFYATKNLPIGEGGMVTTDDDTIAEHVRRSRLHGMSRDAWKRYLPGAGWRYGVEEIGLKANMTDLQAAIGRGQLTRFTEWQRRRSWIADRYDERLRRVPGLGLPARPREGRHAWHLYVVRVTPSFGVRRDELIAALSERGVDCSVHFIPVHQLTYLGGVLGVQPPASDFPIAEATSEEVLSLPFFPGLTNHDVDRVCAAIVEVQRSSRAHSMRGGAQ